MQTDLETYCFDLDNTICITENKNYDNCYPDLTMVEKVNFLYDKGHKILIFTARGMGRFKGDIEKVYNEYFNFTEKQLKKWNVKYHKLILGKPSYEIFIDDKNLSISEFKQKINPQYGILAGAFDLIHPGYIEMFEKAKKNCDFLILALHEDPSEERSNKLKPILNVSEREKILKSIRFIDKIVKYQTEEQLTQILKTYPEAIRFLGEDYKNKQYTGKNLNNKIIFIERNHGWSTTKFKTLINQQMANYEKI